jgi:hypothetical protein
MRNLRRGLWALSPGRLHPIHVDVNAGIRARGRSQRQPPQVTGSRDRLPRQRPKLALPEQTLHFDAEVKLVGSERVQKDPLHAGSGPHPYVPRHHPVLASDPLPHSGWQLEIDGSVLGHVQDTRTTSAVSPGKWPNQIHPRMLLPSLNPRSDKRGLPRRIARQALQLQLLPTQPLRRIATYYDHRPIRAHDPDGPDQPFAPTGEGGRNRGTAAARRVQTRLFLITSIGRRGRANSSPRPIHQAPGATVGPRSCLPTGFRSWFAQCQCSGLILRTRADSNRRLHPCELCEKGFTAVYGYARQRPSMQVTAHFAITPTLIEFRVCPYVTLGACWGARPSKSALLQAAPPDHRIMSRVCDPSPARRRRRVPRGSFSSGCRRYA